MNDAGHATEARVTERGNSLGDTHAGASQRGLDTKHASLGESMLSGAITTSRKRVSPDKKALDLACRVEPYRYCATKEDVVYFAPLTSGDIPDQAA